jgi:hypothetical protein
MELVVEEVQPLAIGGHRANVIVWVETLQFHVC